MTKVRTPLSTEQWLKKTGKEKIQAFQDTFAKTFGISLCLLDLKGRPLTIWSNSSLFCHSILHDRRDRCFQDRNIVIRRVLDNRKTYAGKCYMGLTVFCCPVIYNREIISVFYGGGVYVQDENNGVPNRIDNSIAVLGADDLTKIIRLLEDTIGIFNIDKGTERTENKRKNELESSVFFQNKLSPRELDIANLIISGKTNREISETLYISEKTVKTHVSNILNKLEMKDRIQLMLFCQEHNIQGGD